MARCNGNGHWATPAASVVTIRHFQLQALWRHEKELLPAKAYVRRLLLADS